MGAHKVKLDFVDYSGSEKIKAPLSRVFWYFVTLGKWGERYHFRHVRMRKYFHNMDERLKWSLNRDARPFMNEALEIPKSINCRCSIVEVT